MNIGARRHDINIQPYESNRYLNTSLNKQFLKDTTGMFMGEHAGRSA